MKVTMKFLKDRGWLDFVKWAHSEKLTPESLSADSLMSWKGHLSTKSMFKSLEKDLYAPEPKKVKSKSELRRLTIMGVSAMLDQGEGKKK